MMVLFTRRTLLAAAAVTPILAAPPLLRTADARATSVTVASLLGEEKPETQVWRWIAARLEDHLPGRFRFRIVTDGALGGEKSVADSTLLGSVQASLSTVSTLASWVPELQLLDLPFLYRNGAHLDLTVNGEIGQGLVRRLADEGFVVGGFIDYGPRHLLAKEAIVLPEQMDGRTMRVIQSRLHTSLWSGFGAIPVGIPITETYNALSTGVVDAMDLTVSAYAGFKLYEVVPYLTETAHIRSAGVIFYAKAFWDGLSQEEKGVLMDVSAEAAGLFNEWMAADEQASLEQVTSEGAHVIQADARTLWERHAEPVWNEFEEIVGGRAAIEAVRALG